MIWISFIIFQEEEYIDQVNNIQCKYNYNIFKFLRETKKNISDLQGNVRCIKLRR